MNLLLFIFCALAFASEFENSHALTDENFLMENAKEYVHTLTDENIEEDVDTPTELEELTNEKISNEMQIVKFERPEKCKIAPLRLNLRVDRNALREHLMKKDRGLVIVLPRKALALVAGADHDKSWGEVALNIGWDAVCIVGVCVLTRNVLHWYNPKLVEEAGECLSKGVCGGAHHHKKIPFATGMLVFVVGNYIRLHFNHWQQHGDHFTDDHRLRQKYIRIISLMAPVFAFTCWYGLLNHYPAVHLVLDSAREIYESVTLLVFLFLMYNYLGIKISLSWKGFKVDEASLSKTVIDKDLKSLDWICPWAPTNKEKLERVLNYALTFITLNSVYGVLDLVAEMGCIHYKGALPGSCYVHHSSWFSKTFMIALNVVLFVEVPGILGIEGAFAHDGLHEVKVWWKFAMIKGIVAAMFWQSMLLELFEYKGWWPCTKDHWHHDVGVLNKNIQNFLAVWWMMLFSFGNNFAYTPNEFAGPRLGIPRTGRPVLRGFAALVAAVVFFTEIYSPFFLRSFFAGVTTFAWWSNNFFAAGCFTGLLKLVQLFGGKTYCPTGEF